MGFKVLIMPISEADLDEAVSYYNSISEDLGIRFFNDYQSRKADLSFNPLFYSYYKQDFRRIQFDKFPFIIVYKIDRDNKLVIIHSIVYAGRDQNLFKIK